MRCTSVGLLSIACCLVMLSGSALADDASSDESAYSVFDPTPDNALRRFSPDRPLNDISPSTVGVFPVQVESDFISFTWSTDRLTTIDTLEALKAESRVGLTRFLEFDLITAGLLTDRSAASGKRHGADASPRPWYWSGDPTGQVQSVRR